MYINGNTLARALAIILVTVNHAATLPVGGGMNFLLLLAGYNFAKFSFHKSNKRIVSDLFKLTFKVLAACYLVVFLHYIVYDEYKLSELLLVSNLLDNTRVVHFPIWYPEVLVQMAVMLAPLMLLFNFSALMKHNAKLFTLIFFIAALFIEMFSIGVYGNLIKLPQMFLWNFILGWVVWAYLESNTKADKLIVTAIVLTSFILVFGFDQSSAWSWYRGIVISLLFLIFVWTGSLYLAAPFGQLVTIQAAAILYTFLLHYYVFDLFYLIGTSIDGIAVRKTVKVVMALSLSALTWAFLSAIRKSYSEVFFNPNVSR